MRSKEKIITTFRDFNQTRRETKSPDKAFRERERERDGPTCIELDEVHLKKE
jgi:hypothetical protein